jgi:hypothetical protein
VAEEFGQRSSYGSCQGMGERLVRSEVVTATTAIG